MRNSIETFSYDTSNLPENSSEQSSSAKTAEKEPFSQREVIEDFLKDYQKGNAKKLNSDQRERISSVLEDINESEGSMGGGKKLIEEIIGSRADQLNESFDKTVEAGSSQPKGEVILKFADADSRIFTYVDNILQSAMAEQDMGQAAEEFNTFKEYLLAAKNYAEIRGDNSVKNKAEDYLKQIKKAERLFKKQKQESVLDASSHRSESETLVGMGETKKISKEEQNPVSKESESSMALDDLMEHLKTSEAYESPKTKTADEAKKETETDNKEKIIFLNDKKKEIEIQLSKEEDPILKERLSEQKKKVSEEIIQLASQQPEFKNIKSEIEEEKEKEWQRGIAASGYQNMDNYKKWHENVFYNEVIKNSKMSDSQKETILKEGAVVVSNWPKTIELSRDDVAVAIEMKIDINQISGLSKWNPFSRKIRAGQKVFNNIEEFNNYLADGKKKLEAKDIQERINKRKSEIIEKNSGTIIDNKIGKLLEVLSPKEKPEEKILPVEERLGLLSTLRSKWNKANEIHSALKTGDYRCKIGPKKYLIGEDAKREMENKMTEFSEDIIAVAEKLSGRNLKKEAKKITGYKFDKDPEKQKEYRKWLTDETQKIFETAKNQIEKETGKKIKVAGPKKKLSETNERKFRGGIKKDAKIKPLINREEIEEE